MNVKRANGRQDSISLSQMALYCGVSEKTVEGWIEKGVLNGQCVGNGALRVQRRDAARFLIHNNYSVPYDILGAPSYRVQVVHDDPVILQRLAGIVAGHDETVLTAVCQTADFARMKIVNFLPDMLIVKASMLPRAVCGVVEEEEYRALRIVSVGRPDTERAPLCEDWIDEEADVGSLSRKIGALLPAPRGAK